MALQFWQQHQPLLSTLRVLRLFSVLSALVVEVVRV